MTTLSASEARKRLNDLLDEVRETHEPIRIVGKRSSAVLISEEDWRAIEETLHLNFHTGPAGIYQEGPEDACRKVRRGAWLVSRRCGEAAGRFSRLTSLPFGP